MAYFTPQQLRGLGKPPTVEEQRAEWEATSTPRDGAAATVAQVQAQNEPIERVIDQSYTSISLPGIAPRPQRVSPLSATWQFPVTGSSVAYAPAPTSSRWPWGAAVAGLLLGGILFYMAWEE